MQFFNLDRLPPPIGVGEKVYLTANIFLDNRCVRFEPESAQLCPEGLHMGSSGVVVDKNDRDLKVCFPPPIEIDAAEPSVMIMVPIDAAGGYLDRERRSVRRPLAAAVGAGSTSWRTEN